jgi:hypothetical protein
MAPPLVQWALSRWRRLNPAYAVTVLETNDVAALLGDTGLPWQEMTSQALSDVIRAKLLAERGGIWVDATVVPTQPLNAWLPDAVAETSFFAFERPGPDRPLSSWFLVASPGHYLAVKWWEQIRRFWSGKRSLAKYGGTIFPPDPVAAVHPATQIPGQHPYFWFHYLFEYLVQTDEEFRRQWLACKRRSADPAHALQNLFSAPAKPTENQIRHALNGAPVHKLNWRVEYPIEQVERMLSQR